MKISAAWDNFQTYKEKLRELLLQDDGLSKWEADFLDDISQQDYPPTARQLQTLNKIYEKVFL